MKIAIKNNKQQDHTILRFNGIHEIIPSGQYKILTINSTPELNFWNSVKNSEMEKLGLHLVSDERVVVKIEKMLDSKDTVIKKEPIDTVVTSVFDNCVSPISKEIMTTNKIDLNTVFEPEVTAEDCVESEFNNESEIINTDEYTEEYLNTLSKGELCVILESKNITYRKNSSNANLVKLILGSD